MKKTTVFTIIAKNYFALAKTLGDSLLNFHPWIDFYILIVDPFDFETYNPKVENINLASPIDFIDSGKLKTLAYEYDITELSTAVKPFYIEHLLKQGYEKVIYFDPDILILQPIDDIFQALDNSNIVLVPHILDPIPLDGCLPNEITLLQAGAYNLGFIGVSESQETRCFLAWWCERLEKYCRVAVEEGLFVDQKWIDLVPGMFEKVQILTARGYDVAYWNLNARHLSEQDGAYWVDQELLVFFHFSGFNADHPNQLSKHQNRIKVETIPSLAKLLKHYANLLKANGHDEYKKLPYGYATFSNGVPIDVVARSLLKATQQAGMAFPNPYDIAVEPSFFKWLNSPITNGSKKTTVPITNYLYGLHQKRLDLRLAFPDVLGQHGYAFLEWASQDAIKQGVHPAYLEAVPKNDSRITSSSVSLSSSNNLSSVSVNGKDSVISPSKSDIHSISLNGNGSAVSVPIPEFGVNVAGYLTAELGVGEAGRGYVAALESLGVQTALTDFAVGTPSRKQDNTLSGFTSTNPYPVNLICINADQVPVFKSHIGSQYFENKYNIGVWWWELPDFPDEWRDRFAYFDEIWVGSNYTYESISKYSPVPVIKVPPVVKMHLPQVYSKEYFSLAETEFIFLFVFDFLSLFERKNPLAIVEAFKKAFKPNESVRLVLKCINGEHDPTNSQLLKDAIGDARITIFGNYLSKDEKNGLIKTCDCYVSLHRSEGFGLTLAEAMTLEKPVIATGWSGNMDFMSINNSYLVEYKLVTLEKEYGPYKQGQIWAEPSIQHTAELMRRVYEQPEEAKKKAQHGANDIRLMHSPTTAAKVVKARLDVIHSSMSNLTESKMVKQEIATPTIVAPISISPSLPLEMIANSEWSSKSRFGKLGLFSKKIIERLIRFYVNHQNNINNYLLAANQFIQEQIQQQQTKINSLQTHSLSIGEQIEAIKIENQQQIEILQQNINSQLIANNKTTEQQTQQKEIINNLETQLAFVSETIQAEIQKRIEALQHNINLELVTINQTAQERNQQQETITTNLGSQLASLGEHIAALQAEAQQRIEALQHNINLELVTINQTAQERNQQQETITTNLGSQLASLGEHIAALQAEAQQRIEALQHNINLELVTINQTAQERSQQQETITTNLGSQLASLGEHIAALQAEAQQRIEALQHNINLELVTINQTAQARNQQQETITTNLGSQLASLGEHIAALQAEAQQRIEALQHNINLELVTINQTAQARNQQQETITTNLGSQLASLGEHIAALQADINLELVTINQTAQERSQQQETITTNLGSQLASLGEHIAALQTEIKGETSELHKLKMRFATRPYMQIPIFSANSNEKHSFGYEASNIRPQPEFDYLGFEDVFRGAESFIKERQSVYMQFFANRNLVLDVGCGRGEFLELLAEAGINAIGIDTNPSMVKRCNEKGLSNVVMQECNHYLNNTENKNFEGIFSAQFIEHLPFDTLYEFLTLSREKLTPNGIFIAETVNPHSIEAMKTFFVDLTHVKPLFPEVMLFLCRSAGFSRAEIFYPNGYGFSEEQYWLQGEYAVIAWK